MQQLIIIKKFNIKMEKKTMYKTKRKKDKIVGEEEKKKKFQ